MTDHRQNVIQNARFRLLELQSDNGGTPCEGSPDLFFPEDQQFPDMQKVAREIAISLCHECPIMKECREFGIMLNAPYGIYGGIDFFQKH